jgi:hypothetical protein
VDWLGPALVLYVAIASALVARRRLVHVASLRVSDSAAVVRTIRSSTDQEVARAGERAPAESFEGRLLSAAASDAPPAVRIADVNELLGDLDRSLDTQRDVPKVIGRGALLAGSFTCVLELTLTVAGPGGPAWAPALLCFVLGLAGFFASLEADRRARRAAGEARAEWDRVAAALGERMNRAAEGQGSG